MSAMLSSAALLSIVLLGLISLLFEALLPGIIGLCCVFILAQLIFIKRDSWLIQLTKRINLLKNFGAILMIVIIAPSGKEIGLLSSAVNMLYSGTVLWLLTANFNNRFWAQQVFIGVQLLISVGFIYQQSLVWTLIALALSIMALCALYMSRLEKIQSLRLPPKFIPMIFVSLFIATLLFFVLPALKPFWKLPEQKQTATGLSDKMTPGDVANLASSNRLAFRAEIINGSEAFTQQYLVHANRYWRVLTLENFDGRTWSQSKRRLSQSPLSRARLEKDILVDGFVPAFMQSTMPTPKPISKPTAMSTLSIIAEPSQQPWLLSMGTSVSSKRGVFTTQDARLVFAQNVTKRTKYDATSYSFYNDMQTNELDILLNSKLPPTPLEKTRQLANKMWAAANGDINAYNSQILALFRQPEFVYTLTPPLLDGDHIDDFLFRSKQGFCSHFASAHAVLLRLKGIPARVVTGYHGGEYNPNGNYINIYDSSAHAWVEYISPNGKWRRVDPTSVVSPERISAGLEQALARQLQLERDPIDFVKQTPWLNQIRQQLQSLDYYWTVWVLDYDQSKRENRVKQFFAQINYLTALIFTIVLCVSGFLIYLFLRAIGNRQSDEKKAILAMYKRISKETDINLKPDWTLTLGEHKSLLQREAPELINYITKQIESVNQSLYRNR
jgi:protein-glutamine gamma-glutamyltransferase